MPNRRTFIAGIGTTGTIAIAGCSSTPLIGDNPEDAVEQFYTALQDGDVESANEVFHPESPQYPLSEDDIDNGEEFSITDTEQISTREFLEWQSEQFGGPDDITDEDIAEFEGNIESELDEEGIEGYAIVMISFEADGEEEEAPIFTVQDDGNWYVTLRSW